MSAPTHLWVAGTEAKGGYGGWSYVGVQESEIFGAAGGARGTSELRMALAGLTEGLAAMTPERRLAPLYLHADDPVLLAGAAALPAWRAKGWALPSGEAVEAPEMWEALAHALDDQAGGWRLSTSFAAPGNKEAAAFAAAWATFALDIARTKGTFSSPIPKPNLRTLLGKLS